MQGLDIVTSDGAIHEALATADGEAVYDTLILDRGARPLGDPVDTTDGIVQLVIVNHFDVSRLSVEDIAAMSREEEALYDFKQAVARLAARLPDMTAGEARRRRLEDMAAQVVEEWNERKMTMSRFAREFFGVGLLEKGGKALEEVAKSVLPAATAAVTGGAVAAAAAGGTVVAAPALLAAAPGLVIGAAIYGAGILAKHRASRATSSHRYLSKLVEHGAALVIAPPRPRP